MPRTKETRNFRGSVLKRKAIKNGKKAVAYDARLRVPRRDDDGDVLRDDAGRVIYTDRVARRWSAGEAQVALQNLITEAASEDRPRTRQRIFGDLASYFKREYVKTAVVMNGRKVAGYRRHVGHLEVIVDELTSLVGPNMPLRDIHYEQLRVIAEQLSQTPTRKKTMPATSTVNEKLSVLRRILNVAIQAGWLDVNPFQRGKRLIDRSIENKRNRMLTFEEEARLLAACQPHQVKETFTQYGKSVTRDRFVDRRQLVPLVICAVDTAFRAGEIFDLEPWQIDFENDVIYVTKEAAAETKTGTAGIVPMTRRLKAILIDIRTRSTWLPDQKIFRPFEYRASFNSACREAGIRDLQFRDLRSTGATRMVLAGSPESQVMKTTRHKNLKIFLEHYTNVDIGNAQQIGRNLDEFLENNMAKGEGKGEVKNTRLSRAA